MGFSISGSGDFLFPLLSLATMCTPVLWGQDGRPFIPQPSEGVTAVEPGLTVMHISGSTVAVQREAKSITPASLSGAWKGGDMLEVSLSGAWS